MQVDEELVASNPDMAHVSAGLAHGSLFVPDCSECAWFQFVDLKQNRLRFGLLSVLYGWMVGAEKQFFYSITPPNLVYSFDHDAFFPSGPAWYLESLGLAPYPDVDDVIVDQCGLRRREARSGLRLSSENLDRHDRIGHRVSPRRLGWG